VLDYIDFLFSKNCRLIHLFVAFMETSCLNNCITTIILTQVNTFVPSWSWNNKWSIIVI